MCGQNETWQNVLPFAIKYPLRSGINPRPKIIFRFEELT